MRERSRRFEALSASGSPGSPAGAATSRSSGGAGGDTLVIRPGTGRSEAGREPSPVSGPSNVGDHRRQSGTYVSLEVINKTTFFRCFLPSFSDSTDSDVDSKKGARFCFW